MSNKNKKKKSSQSPKQELDWCPKCTQVKTEKGKLCSDCEVQQEPKKEKQEPAKEIATTPKTDALKEKKQDAGFTFESTARVTGLRIHKAAIELECIARELNTETIFGITAARFQSFANAIKKYPGRLEKKAAKERRILTQTETKEEKKEKKAKALRERIQAMQTKLAAL